MDRSQETDKIGKSGNEGSKKPIDENGGMKLILYEL